MGGTACPELQQSSRRTASEVGMLTSRWRTNPWVLALTLASAVFVICILLIEHQGPLALISSSNGLLGGLNGASSTVHYFKARTAKLTDDVEQGDSQAASDPHTRKKEDHPLCAFPGMANEFGVDCTKVNEDDDFHGKQRARPLMKVPADESATRDWDDSPWESKNGPKEWEGQQRETTVVDHPGVGTRFPYEQGSPVGDLDRSLKGKLDELKKKLDGGNDGEQRGGLEKRGKASTREEEDGLICAVPGLADAVGVDCTGLNEGDDVADHKQRARPLMRVPPQREETREDGGSGWGADRRETRVVDHAMPGTNYPYEQGSPVGELDESVRARVAALRRVLDVFHNSQPRGGLDAPSGGPRTRQEADAAICAVPVLAELFPEQCSRLNEGDVNVTAAGARQRHRPLYELPRGGGGGLGGEDTHDDDTQQPLSGRNDERDSPIGRVDWAARERIRELRKVLWALGHGPTEPRGGLDEAGERWVRQDRDHWICTVPLLAELFGGYKCRGFVHGAGHGGEGKQQHRPLMPARLSEEEEERRRVQAEGRRLRERAEAVDAAEDKMGKYYGRLPPAATATQPKDRIVPAEGGETQEESWRKLGNLIDWLRARLPGFPEWEWEWWEGKGPAAPCGKDDIACGSDLTLHPPHPADRPAKMPTFISPFAGVPIRAKRSPPGKPVPCLHPFCDSPHVGDAKTQPVEKQRPLRSIFAGKPIGPSNLNSAGEPVPCLHPFCDSTASLHKPIKKPAEKHYRFIPFTAGRPIRPRGGKGTGDVVPCVGPMCNSAPYVGDVPRKKSGGHADFVNPLAGSPILPPPKGPPGAPVDFSTGGHPGVHFFNPFAGRGIGAEAGEGPGPAPWDHKGSYTFPGGKGWHGPKGAGEHIGGLDDVHYPAGRVRPWMFRQVYPGQQLRRLPREAPPASTEASSGAHGREGGSGPRGDGVGELGELLKGVWQVPPRDIASAAI